MFHICCLVLSEVCNLHDGNWPTWLNLGEGGGGGKEPPNLISLWSQKVMNNNNIKAVFLKVFFSHTHSLHQIVVVALLSTQPLFNNNYKNKPECTKRE